MQIFRSRSVREVTLGSQADSMDEGVLYEAECALLMPVLSARWSPNLSRVLLGAVLGPALPLVLGRGRGVGCESYQGQVLSR